MARTLKTIFDVLGGRDTATPMMNKVTGSFSAMRGAAKSADRALGGMNARMSVMQRQQQAIMAGGFIGAGFVAAGNMMQRFIGSAVSQAGELEYELASLKGIANASAAEMESLAGAARKAGIETQFTPTQAVQGLQSLAQQGFTTAQQLGALMPSLLLSGAAGGKVPLADAAKLTAQVVKGFGREAEDASIMVDQMVKTTTKSGLAIDDLAGAMQYASSAAQNMEVDFTSTLATLGLIKNVIPSAEVAGSAFQILTARLSKPLNQRKLKENLGINVVNEATGEFRGFGAILLDITEKFAKMASGKRAGMIQEIFGPRGMKGVMPLMTQLQKGITTETGAVLKGQAAWQYWMDTLDPKKVEGFADAMNEMKLDTLNGQIQLLTGSWQTFMMELGKSSAKITKLGVKGLLKTFNTFLTVFQELPEGLKTAVVGFLLLGATITKIIGILLIARVGLRLFGFSLTGLMLGIAKMLLIAAPLTILFSGIALGAYGIYKAVATNFGRAEDSTTSFVEKVKMAWKGLVDIIQTGGLREATVKEFEKMGEQPGLVRFFNWFEGAWKKAKKFFDGVTEGFTAGLTRLEGPWNKFTDTITRIFNIWTGGSNESLKSTDEWTRKGQQFGDGLTMLSEIVLKLMNDFATLAEGAGQSLGSISFSDLIEGIENVVAVVYGIGFAFSTVVRVIKTVGVIIGQGLGSIATQIQGVAGMIHGAFTFDWDAVKLGWTKFKGAITGEFSDISGEVSKIWEGWLPEDPKPLQQKVKKQIETTSKVIRLPEQVIEAGPVGAYRLPETTIEARAEMMSDRRRNELLREELGVRGMKEELIKMRQEIVRELKERRVTRIDLDGRTLGDYMEERARDAEADSFDSPSMVASTAG